MKKKLTELEIIQYRNLCRRNHQAQCDKEECLHLEHSPEEPEEDYSDSMAFNGSDIGYEKMKPLQFQNRFDQSIKINGKRGYFCEAKIGEKSVLGIKIP